MTHDMKTEVVSLAGNGYIQYTWDASPDGTMREFKVYDDEQTLFQGYGFEGTRECRHTYWYPTHQGYGFYPNGVLICAAFKDLSKYFDDMWNSGEDLKKQIDILEEFSGLKIKDIYESNGWEMKDEQ